MAEKRMFSKKITDSDSFAEMSSAAQALYFHLNQNADDDGFNNQVSIAMFRAHASPDDLKVLLAKNYIIRFENGVIVIKHWRLHNTLRKDRYNPTSFKDEFEQLGIKEDGSYTLGCRLVAERLPDGCHREEKIREEEKREIKNNSGGGDITAVRDLVQFQWGVFLDDQEVNEYLSLFAPLGGMNDDNKELLVEALASARSNGNKTLSYVRGCFKNYAKRGIKTNDDYWEYEYERDKNKGRAI